MDSMLEGGSSSRRDSLNSLHRQSGGSLSHGSTKSNSAINGSNSMNSLHKEMDKFARYFTIKSVQIIVQSRIAAFKRVKTECKPSGNDWFNINIVDIAEVSDKTKSAVDFEGFSIKYNWRICCEISLRSTDGGRIVLEHWIISNNVNPTNTNKTALNQQASPKSHLNMKASPLSHSNTNRARPATFSNTMRTRLNSIDDYPSDDNRENLDFKTSASCFTLSSSTTNHNDESIGRHTIAASPSISSLSNNVHGQSTSSTNNPSSSPQSKSKTGASLFSSSLSTVYNRMSLLLKTIMTTTHIVPAYRLASETTSMDDTYEMSYRVYATPSSYHNHKYNSTTKGSMDDISFGSDSPNKRSSASNSSLGSINIREFVGPEELDSFCPILKLGSIKTDINELSVSLCYRMDVKNSFQQVKSCRTRDMYDSISGQDCITAAKQLLAGNEHKNQNNSSSDKKDLVDSEVPRKSDALDCFDKPLKPAFAMDESRKDFSDHDPNLALMESAFEGLLKINGNNLNEDSDRIKESFEHDARFPEINRNMATNGQSEPIQVPTAQVRSRQKEQVIHNVSSESTPKSLTDSFVFVELNPPFASDEQNDINSFFNGPSPVFSHGFDCLKDVDEITNQLAVIEADASQIDEFVDNICVSEDEEDDE